ncbi:hypothetical protein [Vibrio genomosp. F10]|nr:hypothetical protein [Vibrio genomosp. F10]
MTTNKYFVLDRKNSVGSKATERSHQSEQEQHRQKLVKDAQKRGGF